jgi:hypothetical protein
VRTLLPDDQQLLSDQQLRDASDEQLQDLRPRPYDMRGSRVSWGVSKTTLVEALEQPFRLGNLKVANGLHWGEALVEELRNFRRKVNPRTAHVRYEHDRAGDKDDLVLASALACWRSKAGVGLAG